MLGNSHVRELAGHGSGYREQRSVGMHLRWL